LTVSRDIYGLPILILTFLKGPRTKKTKIFVTADSQA
jgi:hypothetical protein